MPVYEYKHNCGQEQQLFLEVDKEHVIIICVRCGRKVTARQVRDNSVFVGEKDGTKGILRKDDPKPRNRRN